MSDEKRSLMGRMWDQMPQISLPKLGRTVEIPIYVVHNAPDPEDYFFIFDFEQFVERSREGIFVRPRLKVWAGRADFNKRRFGRQFRASFASEFDRARAALAREDSKSWGWFNWPIGIDIDPFSAIASGIIVNTILLVAVTTPKAILAAIPKPRFLQGRSDAEKLEASISETQTKVDQALADMEIQLHQELWAHAYKGSVPGSRAGMDNDAWPLPDYVRTHLKDKTSTSWW